MRVLFAWELGANYGHIMRQLPLIKNLRARGHDVLFAVKDIATAEQILQAENIRYVQAPLSRPKGRLTRDISNFADILAHHGFTEPDILNSLIHAWQHLYRLYQPDVVVLDHAPSAVFAATLLGIPTTQIAMGFELPPPVSPYPCFRPWLNLPESALLETEAIILANLNTICAAQQHPPLKQLSDFMRSDLEWLATFPETDHYSGRKNPHYIGPLITTDNGLAVDWPSGYTKNVFVYIRPSDALVPVLDALSRIDANIICVIPAIAPALKLKYETPTLKIYNSHLKLQHLLKRCDLAINYSGFGTISACILAGVPMLVIPTQIEQMMVSKCVARLGIGLAVSLKEVPAHFSDSLNKLLTDPGFTQRALQLAEKYKGYDSSKVVVHIVDSLERLPAAVQILRRKRAAAAEAPVQ